MSRPVREVRNKKVIEEIMREDDLDLYYSTILDTEEIDSDLLKEIVGSDGEETPLEKADDSFKEEEVKETGEPKEESKEVDDIKNKKKKASARLCFFDKNDDVETPREFYDILNKEFSFDHDPCPLGGINLCDGLSQNWGKRNYVNPPYSDIKPWIVKAIIEMKERQNMSVFLIPARFNTDYWFDLIWPNATEIRFIKAGIIFKNYNRPLPVALCLVLFEPNKKPLNRVCSSGAYTFAIPNMQSLTNTSKSPEPFLGFVQKDNDNSQEPLNITNNLSEGRRKTIGDSIEQLNRKCWDISVAMMKKLVGNREIKRSEINKDRDYIKKLYDSLNQVKEFKDDLTHSFNLRAKTVCEKYISLYSRISLKHDVLYVKYVSNDTYQCIFMKNKNPLCYGEEMTLSQITSLALRHGVAIETKVNV
jgi:hypothetical protein